MITMWSLRFLLLLNIFVVIKGKQSSKPKKQNNEKNNNIEKDCDCTDISSIHNAIFGNILSGELIFDTDGEEYTNAALQYASISEVPSEEVSPKMIIYPSGDDDIIYILEYARKCNYSIAIRSGGHQYSALSSCNGCIQIDMLNYNELQLLNDNIISVGSGNRLQSFWTFLDLNNLFVPTGECLNVGVGGHVQTGGIGILINSFGYFLDYIASFDIILSNGQKMHITKPADNTDNDLYHTDDADNTENVMDILKEIDDKKFNDDLYWAVLGGGAGSWGIITNYQISALKNDDFKDSFYLKCIWIYTRDVLLELIQFYTDNVLAYDAIDLSAKLTILSTPNGNVIELEAFYVSFDHLKDNKENIENLLDEFIAISSELQIICNTFHNMTISTAMLVEVGFAAERELPLPFVRRIRYTKTIWNNLFIEQYVNQIDLILSDETNGLFMGLAIFDGPGAAMLNDPNGEYTSLSHRDAMSGMLISIFYSEEINPNSYELVLEWHNDTRKLLLDSGLFNDGTDSRAIWGTFYDDITNELNIEDQWQYYYDSEDKYNRLKQIKKTVDPINLFRNKFTIPILS